MRAMWKKTLMAALPLAGLLLTAPAAFAHDHYHHHHRWWHHHCRPYYGQSWRDRWRYDDDDYRPSHYGWRRYYDRDDYYRSRYSQPSYYGPWWQSFFYR